MPICPDNWAVDEKACEYGAEYAQEIMERRPKSGRDFICFSCPRLDKIMAETWGNEAAPALTVDHFRRVYGRLCALNKEMEADNVALPTETDD